ncbi:MAG: DUF2784 domain-containing protein [Bryobacterales bacterium]|nr:DUF2784 domain-containing protein [Bryobacteraceae bacterium]MDW8354295.1 DUF2784 domain-containing protein [Bryobacterales bacterium]
MRPPEAASAALYSALAALALIVHFAWILWVIFGAFWTRGRRSLSWIHIGSLTYGVVIEVGPWPCPLTLVEQHFLAKAGRVSYEESFLVHYLERLVYPDVRPEWLIAGAAVVCAVNLGIYVQRRRRGAW